MKKMFSAVFSLLLLFSYTAFANEPDLQINAKSCCLTEQTTGKVLYEQNSHERLPIASVTKIMTMLLIIEAVENGNISMDETVTASENAKKTGGSTIFLDTGEQMSVHDLLKGIAIASANDACVAMAEHIAGSESEFVRLMNERASTLKMADTNFMNTNGLPDENHYSSAYDIAIMSRELLKHEQIFEFTTIWMDSLRGGEFELANTNKLISFYEGANGLKTGSTEEAKFCLSGTAKRNGMQLIAVIVGAPTSNDRFGGAKSLLDYGFANYATVNTENPDEALGLVKVNKGSVDSVAVKLEHPFTCLIPKSKQKAVTSEIQLDQSINAPFNEGAKAGSVVFYLEGEKIDEIDLVTMSKADRKSFFAVLKDTIRKWFVH